LNSSVILQNSTFGIKNGSLHISGSLVVTNSLMNISLSEVYVTDNMTIKSNTLGVDNGSLNVSGTLDIEESTLNLTYSNLYVKGDMNISNSVLHISDTKIIVDGCITLNNTIFTVNITSSTATNITILQSQKNCLYGDDYLITYINKPNCTILNTTKDSTSLSVILIKDNTCGDDTSNSNLFIIGAIVIGAFLGIVLIIIILALTIRPFRHALLPKRKIRKELKDRTSLPVKE